VLARRRVRACLPMIGRSGPTTCFTRVQCCQPTGNRDFGHAIRSTVPCEPALDLYGSMPSCAQPCIRVQLSQSLERGFTRCLLRRQRSRRCSNRQYFASRRHDRRLGGVELNLFRPFTRGFDPDDRARDELRAISENRRGLGKAPADDQEQSSERASDKHKIPGYGHSPSLPSIAKLVSPMTAIWKDDSAQRIQATALSSRPTSPQMKFSFTISQTSPPRPCGMARAE
jgi:hypothetical protein